LICSTFRATNFSRQARPGRGAAMTKPPKASESVPRKHFHVVHRREVSEQVLRLAALTRKPDSGFDEIGRQYSENDRLRLPATVFNGLLRQDEVV
jgi:hypothetical protein